MASDTRLPYILLTDYENLYLARYNKKPRLNKFREKWAMQDVIDSVGYDRARELLEYYFKTSKNGHPLNFFYNNFDRLEMHMENSMKDKATRKNIMEATKKLVEEN